ncbi:unnamed protein product [Meganyctiphanes norvegica]|uniref:Fe2OG dioxygenase domain-containing protein n=1 Tax=Meganyctiphanes norvegica TaxID=48144 RepID=A0AAV2RCY8_MEGNR
MSESLSKDECGDSFSEGISDCNIENVMKEGQVKQETLENDCMMEEVKKEFDEGKNKNRESNMNLQVKEEPDQINYAYKSVQKVMKGDIKMMVKEEKKEPVQFEDIEMKVKEDKPVLCEVVEMKVKEEIKTNEQIKNEPDITSKIIESNHINDLNSSIGGLKTKNSHENKFEEKGSVSTYIDDIRDSILLVARPGTFAYGGVLEKAALQLSVEGVGRVKLPLSFKQGEILKSKCMAAPFGRGSETLVSKSVRDAWQVDAKDVTLDKKFKKLIKEQIADIIPTLMGESYTECHQVTSELYKLVYYEKGGHFVAHRDTEKAPGMFATLVIQLPADHMGGSLIVRHKGKTKVFDFQDDSINKYYFTAFFADCEHELKEVTAGQRLVLIYNLLNKNPHSTFNPHKEDNIKSNNNQNFMSIMRNSVQKWKADNKGPRYLALKLDHLYTNANTSFKKLKGKDKIIADALCSCEDIKVYLATINKNSMHWGGYARPKPKPKPIDDDTPDIWYSLDDWLGVNNNEPPFGERNLDTNEMLLKEEIFLKDDKRCGSDYEYTGNEGCTINYFYKKKVLVFFPKSYEIFISCEKNFNSELDNCKKLSESSMDDALDRLKGILLYIEKRKSGTSFDLKRYDSIATIFEIMVKYEHTIICQANTFILTLSKPFAYSTDEKVGLPNTNSAVALANLINKVSWNSLGNSVLQLMKECATSHSESCTQLVSSLFSFGHVEPAISIVELVAPQIIAQNDDLRSRRSIAAWSVFLASHDVFSTHFDVFVKQISQMKDDALNKIIEQMYKSQNLQEIDQYRIKKCFQTFLRILQNNVCHSIPGNFICRQI